MKLREMYEYELNGLKKYADHETEMEAETLEDSYPFRVRFTPCEQIRLFNPDNVDPKTGEVNELVISCGIRTDVRTTLRFTVPAAKLKKLIKLSEKLAGIYYLMLREEADEDEISDTEARISDA